MEQPHLYVRRFEKIKIEGAPLKNPDPKGPGFALAAYKGLAGTLS
jgi:hypothetical protein